MDPARRTPGPRRAGPWLPLALLSGCILLQSSGAAPSLRPRIIAPLRPVRSPSLGESWKLSCQAQSAFPGMSLLYWLANGSFVEDRYRGQAVREGDFVEQPNGTGVLLTRELLFRAFSWRDRCTSFTCVARNPAGLASAPLRWEPERPGVGGEPQQERRENRGTPRGTACVDRAEGTQ
ncbi:interleukin-18-binding protein [Emydura macquarii macquarii]|uniref:interleukin-18-binding protein n=1 Tax=Emydura macquarii macquarii TaxID=1129001 RepID=UPI00352AA05D